MLNCIIVEDELMARKSLEMLCDKSDDIKLVGSFENAESVQKEIGKLNVDLILLDVEMPGMSGIELLDSLSVLPQIIFTTSNTEYAYEAFEYDVTDFIKKPITLLRFRKAIDKALERKEKLEAIFAASSNNEIYIKSSGRFIRIPFDEILYFENVGDYVKVITHKNNHIIHGSLKSIAARIKNPRFIKVHRSYIVNLDKVVDIEDNTLVIEKKVIPISRSHKPILMQSINIL
ncbi:MAG: response regulator transcription factor [Saprospiraceae bacterium]|nr:LytTR family DNA-binding domain-containing protein [Bacteroidia bacterium]NNE15714.1 response regulator transcription factor [Saprospiraceae bacterium]